MSKILIHPSWIDRTDRNGLDEALSLASSQGAALVIGKQFARLVSFPTAMQSSIAAVSAISPCAA